MSLDVHELIDQLRLRGPMPPIECCASCFQWYEHVTLPDQERIGMCHLRQQKMFYLQWCPSHARTPQNVSKNNEGNA